MIYDFTAVEHQHPEKSTPVVWATDSPIVFTTTDIAGLARYFVVNGYEVEIPNPNGYEYVRLWFGESLIVLYNSGTIVVQGNPDISLTVLATLLF